MIKRGLGKGFESLIPTDVVDSDFDPTAAEDEKISDLRLIKTEDIVPDPNQPRKDFDDEQLQDLAASIREHGLLQPIVVTPEKGGKYGIVAGERRYRAAKLVNLDKIPAIIRTLSAQHKLEISIIENVQRKDLNALEVATAYVKLKNQFNLSDADIAARVGKAPSTIANQVRLVGLPDNAKKALTEKKITEGHARQILAVDDPKVQTKLLNDIINNGWSVRKAEQFIIGYKNSLKANDGKAGRVEAATHATRTETGLTRQIASKLGFKRKAVMQKTTAHGGQIIIKYRDDDEIAKIKEILGI